MKALMRKCLRRKGKMMIVMMVEKLRKANVEGVEARVAAM